MKKSQNKVLASRCRAQGGVTNSEPSSTAPTVEVDERAAFEAWMGSLPTNADPHYVDVWMARAALASKPPAREAAERQSIDTPGFRELLSSYVTASMEVCENQKPRLARLIAHIDTWGGAAPAAGNTAQTAYVPLHVLEALRAGCKVATTLTPGKDADHTEAVQLLPNNN